MIQFVILQCPAVSSGVRFIGRKGTPSTLPRGLWMGSLWDCSFLPCCTVGARVSGFPRARHKHMVTKLFPSIFSMELHERSTFGRSTRFCCFSQWKLQFAVERRVMFHVVAYNGRAAFTVSQAVLGTAGPLWTDWGLVWAPSLISHLHPHFWPLSDRPVSSRDSDQSYFF